MKAHDERVDAEIERLVDMFMAQYPLQYNLFHSHEEVEAVVREIAREGVLDALTVIHTQLSMLDKMSTFEKGGRGSGQ